MFAPVPPLGRCVYGGSCTPYLNCGAVQRAPRDGGWFVASGQTRRRLGGRQPLCGIGVTSLIDLMSSPDAASARIADSRPAPGPLTFTSTERTPCSVAICAAFCAAT